MSLHAGRGRVSRERDALLAVGDLVSQIEGDLDRLALALALACLSLEVEDGLRDRTPPPDPFASWVPGDPPIRLTYADEDDG